MATTFLDNKGKPFKNTNTSASDIKLADGQSVQNLSDFVKGQYVELYSFSSEGNNQYVDVLISATNFEFGETYFAKANLANGTIVYQQRTDKQAVSQNNLSTDENGIFSFKVYNVEGSTILRFRNCTKITFISYETIVKRINDLEGNVLDTREKRMQWLSMDFVKKISPFATGQRNNHISFYCFPDLHCCWESIKFHKMVFENSENYNNHCIFAITAGDILYSTESKNVYNDCKHFVEYAKDFAKTNAFILPAIGGHDFNNISSVVTRDESVLGNLTKEEQRNLIIQPCLDLIGQGFSINIPSDPTACYYCIVDNVTNMYYVVLDECDHENVATGIYNGNTITIKINSIDKPNKVISGSALDDEKFYSNISCEGFNYVHSRYESTSYSQQQIDWIISLLKSIPNGGSVAFFNHTGLLGVELHDNANATKSIGKMIEAFVARTLYTNSGNDGKGYSWTINADFSNCEGKLLGIFRGHLHKIFTRKNNNSYYEFASSNAGYYSSENGGTKLMCEIEGDLFDYIKSQGKIRRFHIGRQGEYAKPDVDLSDYDGVVI